jgi:hypothetical protein
MPALDGGDSDGDEQAQWLSRSNRTSRPGPWSAGGSRVDRYASRPVVVLLVLAAVASWVGLSIAAGFPARWEATFQTLVACLTLAMVFVIQHTQAS